MTAAAGKAETGGPEEAVDLSTLMFVDKGWLEHHTMNVRF